MATAAELLAQNGAVDKTLIISNDLRTITIPSSVPCLGVEYDDEVLELDFKMPRYLGETDLSEFAIHINYINAKGESDRAPARNIVVDDEYITFSWLVGPIATRFKGETNFIVCLRTYAAEGYVDREFNTTITKMKVLEGLEVEIGATEQVVDMVEQWKQELQAISLTEQEKIAKAAEEAIESFPDITAEDVLATFPKLTALDFTNYESGSFVETIDGEDITHSVTFDDSGRPVVIDDIAITWGDVNAVTSSEAISNALDEINGEVV
jgi:hypothetical protein